MEVAYQRPGLAEREGSPRGQVLEARAAGRGLLEEREAELEAARAKLRTNAEVVAEKDAALRRLTLDAEAAAARAAKALRAAGTAAQAGARARPDHHVWSLGPSDHTALAAQVRRRESSIVDWIGFLVCDVPIRAHFNTSHEKAHCALSRVGAGLRR
jgi:hypothetical protein